MKKLTFLLYVFTLQLSISCFAQELPENFEHPWRLEYQGKWIVQNTVDTTLVMDFPASAIVRYCAGENIVLSAEYAGNRGNITFAIIPDQESETGVCYEIREIQILCE